VKITMAQSLENRPGDVRIYITDNSRVDAVLGWQPRTPVEKTLTAIDTWLREHPSIASLWT